jgi:hypothetical protein
MDDWTRQQIDKAVERVLAEAGIKTPPVRVEDLLDYLRVHRDFYNLQDPVLLQRFWHKVKVQKQKLIQVVNRIKLSAVWLPNEERILVDQSQPQPKQEWASFHDGLHRILDWHRPFFLGDTATTLDPDYQETLEEEANYGASAAMFCGRAFTADARDVAPNWSGLQQMKQKYRKSWVTTLRRFVEHGHDLPMAMMVSTPPWLRKPDNQENRYRHFVGSSRFDSQFPDVITEDIRDEIDRNTRYRRGGPVGEFSIAIRDANGNLNEFLGESFFNQHDILTLMVHQTRPSQTRIR